MDVNELRRLPMPKLRDVAKAETELRGVGGMEKEELIKAIAKAKNIPYEATGKDVNAIHSIKHDIRELKKQKTELLTSSGDSKKLNKVQKKMKRLKRLTRHLAREAKTAAAVKAAAPAEAAAPAAAPAAPTETPPAAG
jgi:hypothetical protein